MVVKHGHICSVPGRVVTLVLVVIVLSFSGIYSLDLLPLLNFKYICPYFQYNLTKTIAGLESKKHKL